MKTFFASPERASAETFQQDIDLISNNPVINALLNNVSGLFAILNQHRQILSVNDTFLETLGVEDVNDIVSLRPGESLQCVHAHDGEGGCGTGEYCPTCGAAISIVLSLERNAPVEKLCAIETERNQKRDHLYLLVKSLPVVFDDRKLILLFLQDMTLQQKLSTLERVFFHDIANMISGLQNSSNQLMKGNPEKQKAASARLKKLTSRLAQEVNLQRVLIQSELPSYQVNFRAIALHSLFEELSIIFDHHPASFNKTLIFSDEPATIEIKANMSLLIRVLSNMITNALEGTDEGGSVRVSSVIDEQGVSIKVWNHQYIPSDISKRIFQRNWSTKEGRGRGLGTYSMKLLGEQFLGGSVAFTTSKEKGTEFSFTLKHNKEVSSPTD